MSAAETEALDPASRSALHQRSTSESGGISDQEQAANAAVTYVLEELVARGMLPASAIDSPDYSGGYSLSK